MEGNKKALDFRAFVLLEATVGLEPTMRVLQTLA